MSFGYSTSSTTFATSSVGGKPLIFWDQQAQNAKNAKKKFGYKSKELQHPLRSRNMPEPQAPPPQRGRRKPANQKKANPVSNGNGRTTSKKPESAVDPNSVTLTQKEFDTILETIGRLAIETENLKSPRQGEELHEDPKPKTTDSRGDAQEETIFNLASQPNKPDTSHDIPPKALDKPPIAPQNRHNERRNEPEKQAPKPEPAPNFLSKAERKRLQWEKERAQQSEEWNPWGRPGCGAPVKDREGNTLTDYSIRQDRNEILSEPSEDEGKLSINQKSVLLQEEMQKLGITPSPRQPKTPVANPSTSAFEYSKDDPLLPHQRAALQAREPQPPPAVASQRQPPPSTQRQKSEEPAAIRSSFVVGNGTPDDDRFVSAKERKRLLWLQELEQQREEDRQRKAKEKSYGRQDEETHWADKFSNYQPKGLPAQDSIAPPPPNDTAARISSAPVQTMDSTSNKLEDATYLRGQNTRIDPVTLRELEDKRKKEQQHQDFIRQQIEEKARLKREERERRVREEIEEEKQLQKERTHGLTHREDAKQKEKDEAERKRALEEAIERAQEAAEMDKHQKRLLKLQQGGHDVSNFETKTPRNMLPAQFNTGTIVEPSHVPGLDSSPRDVETRNQGCYTENRVLTPTDQRTARKEFGVQTESDITLGNREETDIEYQGPFSKKVRIKSGPKDGRPKKPVKINERPKWGYQNAAKKKAVKQSARDPHYEQKKQRAEIMKQERQQAMLKMQQEQRRTVTRETAASRSRSHEPKSPMIPKHQDYDQYARQNLKDTSHKSQTPPPSVPTKHRSPSPPVPTIKHMIRECDDQYKQTSSRVGGSKYADMDPTYNNSDFIPFVRTTDLLDPSKADESVPVSREQSAVQRGRKVYQQELNPAKYGKKMANIKDKNESYTKDPILQPNLVTEHPTSRQGQILQQLSSLRRGLMLKQRELEMNDGALGLA